MIQNVVRHVGGIAGFGVISVCLFFAVFTTALIWALIQRKSHCLRMSSLPLESGSIEEREGSNK
jgi:hypothetical protein